MNTGSSIVAGVGVPTIRSDQLRGESIPLILLSFYLQKVATFGPGLRSKNSIVYYIYFFDVCHGDCDQTYFMLYASEIIPNHTFM